MRVIVTGGTGTVGSSVIHNLVEKKTHVRCMTRSKEKIDAMPEGVEGFVGDMSNPESLDAAFDGMDCLFLVTALDPNETRHGLASVEAARNAGIKKIVYLSVPMAEHSKHIPHFKSKIPVEEAIKASGMDYTILRPNNFFQNDYWFQETIMSFHVYPQPIGSIGMNRVDVRDIADAAVNAITGTGEEYPECPVHSLDILTGEKVAEIYSRHLNFEVKYGGDDLDAWSEQAKAIMPGWMVDDLRIMYQFFQDYGFLALDEDLETQKRLLGHEPRAFNAFVAETVSAWKE